MLERRGLLTSLDASSFGCLCTAWAIIQKLTAIIENDGITITGPRGKLSVHPAARERAKWEKELLAWAREFGLTPSSRRRLNVPEEDDEDDEFFRVIDGRRKREGR
jgi:P27 family predicted phage terminase small subunit